MTHLSEVIALYRNDPNVSDEWFARLMMDARAIDEDSEREIHSRIVPPNYLTSEEFEDLVREAESLMEESNA